MVRAAYPMLTRSRMQMKYISITNGMIRHQIFRSSAASSISGTWPLSFMGIWDGPGARACRTPGA